MFWRITLGVIGFIAANIIGAIIGFVIGSIMDKGKQAEGNPEDREKTIKTIFVFIGYVLRQKGSISSRDIELVQYYINEVFELNGNNRQAAFDALNLSKDPSFNVERYIKIANTIRGTRVKQFVITTLIEIAVNASEGQLFDRVRQAIISIAIGMGFRDREVELRIDAQINFYSFQYGGSYGGGNYQEQHYQNYDNFNYNDNNRNYSRYRQNYGNNRPSLAAAYKLIGVSETDNQQTIKRAYRKLMHEYHPDKLKSQNLPPEQLKAAELKAKDINTAMDMINQARGWS